MKNTTFNEFIENRPLSSKNWGWLLAIGILLVLLGIVALAMPIASTASLMVAVASLLVVGGIIHLVNAFKLRHFHGSFLRFFQAIIAIIGGALMFRYPAGGMLSIAVLLSFYFFSSAAFQLVLSSSQETQGGIWGFIGATLSFLLGLYIVMSFPFSALWVPGVVLAIEFIYSGAAMIAVAASVRKVDRVLTSP